MSHIAMDLHSPEFKADPYPTFAQVRSEDPVQLTEFPGNRKGWLITRYEDADKVLRDARFVKDPRHAFTQEELQQQFPALREQESGDGHREAFTFGRNMLGIPGFVPWSAFLLHLA